MADDQPQEISFPTQTTPGHTELSDDAGARSAYDPPLLSPQEASAAAFESQLGQLVSGSGVDDSAGVVSGAGGVTRSVVQTPSFPPVTVHTAGISYTIPFDSGTPPATRR